MIVDIYTHIFPRSAYERMTALSSNLGAIGKRIAGLRFLHDLDGRFREMDTYGDYRQIISMPNPPLEDVMTPRQATQVAEIANDAMADLVGRHPDRFPAFVACLAMNDMDAAMVELERAIDDLGARGVQIFTNVAGRPLDDPAFEPLFAAMANYGLPIWLHPVRSSADSDYAAEKLSRFETWTSVGWPHATSVAMIRMVYTGLFDRYPGIKIITHHLGGNIPYHEGRIETSFTNLGRRSVEEDYQPYKDALRRPVMQYYRMFYGDTAMHGAINPLRLGIEFFGVDNVVFASDAPFAPIHACIRAVEHLELDPEAKRKIFCGNAERLMNMSFA